MCEESIGSKSPKRLHPYPLWFVLLLSCWRNVCLLHPWSWRHILIFPSKGLFVCLFYYLHLDLNTSGIEFFVCCVLVNRINHFHMNIQLTAFFWRNCSFWTPGWLSQLSVCLRLRSWTRGPGIEFCIGLLAWRGACFLPLPAAPLLVFSLFLK